MGWDGTREVHRIRRKGVNIRKIPHPKHLATGCSFHNSWKNVHPACQTLLLKVFQKHAKLVCIFFCFRKHGNDSQQIHNRQTFCRMNSKLDFCMNSFDAWFTVADNPAYHGNTKNVVIWCKRGKVFRMNSKGRLAEQCYIPINFN